MQKRPKNGIRKSKAAFEKEVKFLTPDAFIYTGDRIEIGAVEEKVTAKSFRHQHDEHERHAHLLIIRRSGKIEKVKRPLVFFGKMAIERNRANSHLSMFEKIVLRIRKHFDINTAFESKMIDIIESHVEKLPAAERAYKEYWRLCAYNKEALAHDATTDESEADAVVLRAIENAISLG